MKKCNFDPNKCSVECKKYAICSYYSIQNQFIEVKSQLNFIYNTIAEILKKNESNDIKINLLEKAIREKISCEVDSEMIVKDEKESKYEKEN